MLAYLRNHIKQWQIKRNVRKFKNLILSRNEPNPVFLVKTAAQKAPVQNFRIEYPLTNFTEALWDAFIQAIDKNQAIQTLNFSSIGLNDADIFRLASALKENQHLKILNLRKNNITLAGAETLADILTGSNQLKKLVLSENSLDKGFNTIFQALQTNAQLTSLVIRNKWGNNGIEDTHVDAISEMLKVNGILKQLNLCGNQFSDQGIQKLCQGLSNNKTLHLINLDSNTIGDAGWLAIGDWVSKTSSLQSLSIGCEIEQQDSITKKGLTGFLNAFTLNTSIKHLSISFKKDSDILAVKLAEILKTNRTLESITLKNCPHAMKQQGVEALVSVLKTNTSVCEIKEGELIQIKPSHAVKSQTAKELKQLLARNKLIKAIKETPADLPRLMKNASDAHLDELFFATVIKSLPEPFLIKHEAFLLAEIKKRSVKPFMRLKKWFGIHQNFSNIQNIVSLLAQQAQANDDKSQMALGYIYKNQLFEQPLDPTQAQTCFMLATSSKDKTIAANAHFEVGHIHFIYTRDLQRATTHFDKASAQTDTKDQADRMRNHALYTLNKSHKLALLDEKEQKIQLEQFHKKQKLLDEIRDFFNSHKAALSKSEETSTIPNHCTSYLQQQHMQLKVPPKDNITLKLVR